MYAPPAHEGARVGVLRSARHGSRRSRARSLLFRTVDFFALNNIFVPTPSTAIAVRYGVQPLQGLRRQLPEVRRRNARLPGEPRQRHDLQHVSHGQHHRLQRPRATAARARTTHVTQTANASVSQLKGSHTIKFGGEYRRIGADVRSFSSSAGTYSFTQAFTRADADGVAAATRSPASCSATPASGSIVYATPAEYLVDYYAAYAQDEWRVSSKLTVNYGLRYEYEPGMREADNHVHRRVSTGTPTFPVQVPGLALKGGLMYAGENGYPTRQGEALNGVAPRGGVCVVADEQRRHSRRLRLLLGADAVFGRRRNGDGALGLHGDDDLPREHGRQPDAGELTEQSVSVRHHSSAGQLAGPGHGRGRRDRLRRSEFAAGPGAAVFGRLHARAAGRHRGVDRLLGQPVRAPAGGRHDRRDGQHQPARSEYLSLGPALLELVPNPFFGNRRVRQPCELGHDRARSAAAAVPAVHQRAGASRHRSARPLQRDDRCAWTSGSGTTGA